MTGIVAQFLPLSWESPPPPLPVLEHNLPYSMFWDLQEEEMIFERAGQLFPR